MQDARPVYRNQSCFYVLAPTAGYKIKNTIPFPVVPNRKILLYKPNKTCTEIYAKGFKILKEEILKGLNK